MTSRWTTPARCAAASAPHSCAGQMANIARVEAALARQPVGKIAARVVVHHQEQLPVGVDDVADREHVRVRHLRTISTSRRNRSTTTALSRRCG